MSKSNRINEIMGVNNVLRWAFPIMCYKATVIEKVSYRPKKKKMNR